MEMHESNSPIRYIYCLVDHENERFKFGSTSHAHYAPALAAAYCPFDSFQIGYTEEIARRVEKVMLDENEVAILSEPGEDGSVWMHMAVFEMVRATLCHVQHVVPPTVLCLTSAGAAQTMVDYQLEKERLRLCAKLDELLGLK